MRGELLTGAHTQNIGTLLLHCNNTTPEKTKASKALIVEGKGAY